VTSLGITPYLSTSQTLFNFFSISNSSIAVAIRVQDTSSGVFKRSKTSFTVSD
jgi:hypothetical protein